MSASGDDNLNIATPVVAGNFEHPDCGGGVADIIDDLPDCYPIGPTIGPDAGAAPSCP